MFDIINFIYRDSPLSIFECEPRTRQSGSRLILTPPILYPHAYLGICMASLGHASLIILPIQPPHYTIIIKNS